MKVAFKVLHALGAYEVPLVEGVDDPQTKEEFEALSYKSSTPIQWEDYLAKYDEIMMTTVLKQLRIERNKRIAKTDWIMTVDNAETLANKNEWIAYRQALRDLPEKPPTPAWNGHELDFSKMNMPVEPPVIRVTVPPPAPAPEPAPEPEPTPSS